MTTTANHNRRSTKKDIYTVMTVLLLVLIVAVTGCGKGNSSKEGKSAHSAESAEKGGHKGEETGHKEDGKDDHKDEEQGMVRLSPEKIKASGIEVRKVAAESVSAPVSATAVIELNGDRVSKVSSRVTGRMVKVMASQGSRVSAGQPLAYMDSVELDQAWSDYVKAKGRQDLASRNLKREETLFEKKVSPEKDVLKARQDLGDAESDLALARERFRLFGIDPARLEAARQNDGVNGHPLIPVSSSIGGTVIERTITAGEMVNPEKVLFTVADLSTLWVVIDIHENDIIRLKRGMSVKITATAFPDRSFKGTISYVGDMLDEKTRVVKARVTVDNSSGILKPGMFAAVSIDSMSGEVAKMIVIPEEALSLEGSERYVFLQTAQDIFKKQVISVGRTLGKSIEVLGGLKEGDTIVVKGAFTLKAEMKKESVGHGH